MELHEKIELFQRKLNIVETALERNWKTQIILTLLAADSIVGGFDLLRNVAKRVYQAEAGTEEIKILQLIVAVLLTYTFIRFGFLLRGFVRIRRSCEELLRRIISNSDRPEDSGSTFLSVFEAHGFFEPYYHVGDYMRDNKILAALLSLFGATVAAANHSMVILMYFSALPQFYANVATAVTVFLIFGCYRQFYKSTDVVGEDESMEGIAVPAYGEDARARRKVSLAATALVAVFTTFFVAIGLYNWVF